MDHWLQEIIIREVSSEFAGHAVSRLSLHYIDAVQPSIASRATFTFRAGFG